MFNVLPQTLREIIIGCALGDLHIAKQGKLGNASLHFAQSSIHSEYLLYLYSLFECFSTSPPKTHTVYVSSTGKRYPQLRFQTHSSNLFDEYHSMFYLKGNKVVPVNIGEYLTARSISFWANGRRVSAFLQAMDSIFVLTLLLGMKFYFFVQFYKISLV